MKNMAQETNLRGNTIERNFLSTDRYHFDFGQCSPEKGWKQWDTNQDAWYFGVWVHPEKMEILTYAEGDVILVKCQSKDSFKAELQSMAEFYGPVPPAAIGLSEENGQLVKTEYYDDRYMGEG